MLTIMLTRLPADSTDINNVQRREKLNSPITKHRHLCYDPSPCHLTTRDLPARLPALPPSSLPRRPKPTAAVVGLHPFLWRVAARWLAPGRAGADRAGTGRDDVRSRRRSRRGALIRLRGAVMTQSGGAPHAGCGDRERTVLLRLAADDRLEARHYTNYAAE